MSFRDKKVAMRERLHGLMQSLAFLYPEGLTDNDPEIVSVRVHTQIAQEGDIKGTSFAYAEKLSEEPRLVFLAREHVPRRGDIVMLSPVEGYRVDATEPQDTITISAKVVRLSKTECEDYDAPPGAV